MLRSRRILAPLGVALLALAVAATAAARVTAGAAPAKAKPKPLVIAINQLGEVYDPTSVLPSTISVVASNVFDWLWWRTPKGLLVPNLVSSWNFSPDGKQLILALRKNVRFSSGDPFTAEDVVFSWQRLKANGFSDRIARTLTSWDVTGKYNLVAHFAAPEIGVIPSLGFPIVSKAYYDRVGEATFKAKPVGTGPYMFKKIVPDQSVTLVANPRYWAKKPTVKEVTFQTVTDDTARVAKLKTGAADMIMQVPFQNVAALQKKFRIVTLAPSGSSVYIAFKYQRGKDQTPWADPQVRQAVALAIDRNAIVKKLLKGIPRSYPFLAPGDLGYDRSLQPYPYNPARAKQLLTAAGYPNGFTAELPYLNAQAGMSETANAVALYLQQVGIKVTPKALNGQDFVQWVFAAARNPAMDYMAIFLGAIAGKAEPATALLNSFSSVTPFAWYKNPQANGLILQANATPDDQARAALIQQVQRIIYNDYGFVKLWDSATVYAMKKCIRFTPQLGDFDMLLLKRVTSNCTMK